MNAASLLIWVHMRNPVFLDSNSITQSAIVAGGAARVSTQDQQTPPKLGVNLGHIADKADRGWPRSALRFPF
jgi:hypothetical protein